jgi:hypothetical protein
VTGANGTGSKGSSKYGKTCNKALCPLKTSGGHAEAHREVGKPGPRMTLTIGPDGLPQGKLSAETISRRCIMHARSIAPLHRVWWDMSHLISQRAYLSFILSTTRKGRDAAEERTGRSQSLDEVVDSLGHRLQEGAIEGRSGATSNGPDSGLTRDEASRQNI